MLDRLMHCEGPEELPVAKGHTPVWQKRKKMRDLLQVKIKPRTSLKNTHSPAGPHRPPGRGPASCSTCGPLRARQGGAGMPGTGTRLHVSRPGHC